MNIKTSIQSLLLGIFCLVSTVYPQRIQNAVADVACPLPLSSVRVTGGPLKRTQDLNGDYLLKLEPDRMMAYYRKRAGLEPKAAGYTGWDGDGRNLTGHIAGHYLSGVSLMYAATGDERFKPNVYNMLKMTRRLFALQPDIKYAEFEERALFNHILASIDPEDGRTCYMVPIGRSVRHEYQEMFRSFTCCVGSGMESHGA